MFLSVIIPAYNEERRLPRTLEKVRDYLSAQKYDWEVLIVNDGSKDRTAEVVSELINPKSEIRNPKQITNYKFKNLKNNQIRFIDNHKNQGKGAVVRQGMLAAKGDWRLFMDADGSTDISEVEKLFNFVNPKSEILNHVAPQKLQSNLKQIQNSKILNSKKNYEIVIGSRYLESDSIKIKQPLGRRVISRLGNVLVRLLLGVKSVDTQCGFKLFSKSTAEKIFPLQTINRWGFDIEILAIAIKKGYKIKEVPVDWYDAEGSQVKKGVAWKTLKELFAIKWNLVRGIYK